jgi:hypothetical protein
VENAVESAKRSARAMNEANTTAAAVQVQKARNQQVSMELREFTAYSSKASCLFLVHLGAGVLHSFAAIVLRKSIQQSGENWATP